MIPKNYKNLHFNDIEEKTKELKQKANEELEFANKFDVVLENKILDQAVISAESMITEFISK